MTNINRLEELLQLFYAKCANLCSFELRNLPAEGLEPTRSCDHWILSPARLPVPPRRRRFLHSITTNEDHEADRKSIPCKLRGGPKISRRIIALRKANGELNSVA